MRIGFRTVDGVRIRYAETERMVCFRDRLRASAADRALYARTKRELAVRDWKYLQQYADAKTDVVEQILIRAVAR